MRSLPRSFRLTRLSWWLLLALVPGLPAPARAVAPFAIQVVDGSSEQYVGEYTSLRVDHQGHPHVAYYDGLNGNLKYAVHDGTGWLVTTADSSANDVGQFASLALDSLDRPHIAYYDETLGRLRYAAKLGPTWTHELADSASFDCGWYTSIAIDRLGRPWIASYDRGTGNPRLSFRTPGGWVGEYVDTTFDLSGFYISLALDAKDVPHVSYYDLTHHRLVYATKRLEEWLHENADSSADDVGLSSSLRLDRFGRVHIAYMDLTHSDLKYALRIREFGGRWQRESVHGGPEVVGYDCALTLDPLGYPVISYHDGTALDLRLVHRDVNGWHSRLVDDSPGIEGLNTSVGTDAQGGLFVSYWDGTEFTLRVAAAPPQDVTAVSPAASPRALTVSPNPARSGARLVLRADAGVRAFEVFDVAGRSVVRLAAGPGGAAVWDTRRDAGRVRPGLYFARPVGAGGRAGESLRIALIG